eukprot:jgi/Botrbrau1/16884/Bobra.150_2s0100.2
MASSTGEWLASVLQDHRNPLPYGEPVRYILRQHLLDLVQEFPALKIDRQTYTYPDGRVVQLLTANGTLPVYYQGVKYNLPIALWLPEKYPQMAPILYVVPTPDMIVKPRHSFVDPAGLVNSLYLINWSYSRSNLVDLCHDSAIGFGKEPPLFSCRQSFQQPAPAHHPPPAHPPVQSHFHHHEELHNPLASARPSLWDGALAAQGSRPSPQPSPQPPAPAVQQPPPPATDLRAAFRKNAMAMLTKRLKAAVKKENETATAELDRLIEQQHELTRRKERLTAAVQEMQVERKSLEEDVKELSGKAMALQRWLDENEARCPEGNIDPDTAIVPAEKLSEQGLDVLAEDRAIDDLLSVLDRALEDNVVQLDPYLRQASLPFCHQRRSGVTNCPCSLACCGCNVSQHVNCTLQRTVVQNKK